MVTVILQFLLVMSVMGTVMLLVNMNGPWPDPAARILAACLVNCSDPIVHGPGPNLEGSESED